MSSAHFFHKHFYNKHLNLIQRCVLQKKILYCVLYPSFHVWIFKSQLKKTARHGKGRVDNTLWMDHWLES